MGVPLLTEVIAAHGGVERWARVRELKLRVRVGGVLFAMKLKSPRLRSFECIVDPHRVHMVLRPFPHSGQIGVFEFDNVRIETEGGAIVAHRNIRHDGQGKVERRWVWKDLDVIYFLGYALWNYAVTPYIFCWPGFECEEGAVWREGKRTIWRTLCVRYPVNFPTHSREQTFYFDERGWLRRLDYTADFVGEFARGAHICEAHRTFDGFVFPTHRIVYPRRISGQAMRMISVIEGWIDEVTLV